MDHLLRSATPGPMPLLFVGHGNPMNAITDNNSPGMAGGGRKHSRKPNAILCVSGALGDEGNVCYCYGEAQDDLTISAVFPGAL